MDGGGDGAEGIAFAVGVTLWMACGVLTRG